MEEEEWITCPRCNAEGKVDMDMEQGRIVLDSGCECPLCKGAMGFDDQFALERAEAAEESND